jgi:hypothetical protein
MTVVCRSTVSAAAALVLAVMAPLRAMADTGPRPIGGDTVSGGTFEPASLIGPGVVVAVVALVTIIAIRRPGRRRPIAGLLTVVGSGLVALALVAAGLFSDFSGQHRTYPPLVIGGVVALVVGLILAARIVTGGRAPTTRT